MSNETQNSVPKYLSTPERIASELDSIRDRLMTRGIVSGERLYGCDEWSEPVVRLQKVIEALQSPAHDGEVASWQYRYMLGNTGIWSEWEQTASESSAKGIVQKHALHKLSAEYRATYTAPPRVVDEAMVKRACNAYDNQLDNLLYLESLAIYPAMRAALKAALEKQ